MGFFLRFTFFFFLGIHLMTAQLSLPNIFANNMILQRDEPIHFWGKGIPNTSLEVKFGRETMSTEILHDSTWSVLFEERKANSEPLSILISNGKQKLVLTNVLIGDVWLCIGQSNMEWPLEKELHFKEEIKNANRPSLRFYNLSYAGKNIYNESFTDSVLRLLNKKNFFKGKWEVSNSNSIKKMSAVGYYFGKEILEEEEAPIGLINIGIGGAPIETFISRKTMEDHIKFSKKIEENWLTNNELPVWIRERGIQNVGAVKNTPQDDLGPNHAFKPGFAFSEGILPLTQMPIKGIIWYQGESNAQEWGRVNEYAELQKLMTEDYRRQWKQPELPFYWVQLSSIDTANYKSHYWPEFRNEQRKLLYEIPYGGMAVTSDIGAKNDVHPTNKKDVGERLARWALNRTYGKKVLPSGPLPKEAEYNNGRIVITFDYAANGLKTSDGKEVRGFSLDRKHEARGVLKDNTVEISSEKKPEYVLYGWQPYSQGNLVNTEGLPASTFKLKVE